MEFWVHSEFCCLSQRKVFSRRVATVAMLPSALSRSDWFARCMLGVLGSAGAAICLAPSRFTEEWNAGQAINAVTGTRLWAFVFSLPGMVLILVLPFVFMRLRPRGVGAVVQRLVYLPSHPQVMQQHRQLS